MTATAVDVDGRTVHLSSLDKLLWPQARFTKGDMLDYYRAIAPALLPHLAGRPLTLGRFPDGVEGRGFAQNECRGSPEWLRTHAVTISSGTVRRFCVVDDLPSLLWVVNQNALELHPFLALAERPDHPTAVVFDLDPGDGADLADCCDVALRLRTLLSELGLVAFAKTSGAAGLHVFVPVSGATFEETRPFARELAARLAAEQPERVTDRQARGLRAGKVLVDWLQNDPMRSTVAPYSLRAMPFPTVSMPVRWEEVEALAAERRTERMTFLSEDALVRVERNGDLLAPLLEARQSLRR